MKHCWLLIIVSGLSFVITKPARAGLVVNEVMADEPSGHTSLEWIEIYNDSPDSIYLGLFPMQIGNDTLILPSALAGNQYAIVCRKLYGDGSSPAFEEVWGDSSGVWGDSPIENYKEPIELSFPFLGNAGGLVIIKDASDQVVSDFLWTSTAGDGVSWERESVKNNTIIGSVDELKGTPGFVNSVTPLGHDLELQKVVFEKISNTTQITFDIKSRSLGYVIGDELTVYQASEAIPDDRRVVLETITLPGMDSAATEVISLGLTLNGTYSYLLAELSDDDRTRNNCKQFKAPAQDYPPVILSEVQAHPTGFYITEWFEIYNRTDTVIDLSGWFFGDTRGTYYLATSELLMESGEYLVITQDTIDFRSSYPEQTIHSHEPDSWPRYNDKGDTVKLIDPFKIEADFFGYQTTDDNNFTWSRAIDNSGTGQWGRSHKKGGSPGEENVVVLNPTGSSAELEILPKIFSPDGDGRDEQALIYLILPEASGYLLKIYDRAGREVRTFLDGEKFVNPDDVDGDRLIWLFDGLDNNGKRLPIGIYIVYFEATGLESFKESLVIAR